MKSPQTFPTWQRRLFVPALVVLFGLGILVQCAVAQPVAYDEAGNYLVNANWTNGANEGYGFTPWEFTTNGTDFNGEYVVTLNNPPFVIDSITNVGGTNYTNIWGIYANGTNSVNTTVAYRGFSNSLGTNTFQIEWGSRGAGSTVVNGTTEHGWCGFTLRNANDTNGFANGVQLYFYFLDGSPPPPPCIFGTAMASIPSPARPSALWAAKTLPTPLWSRSPPIPMAPTTILS